MAVLPETATEGTGNVLADAFDSKGRPADRSRTGGYVCALLIGVVELCERLTTLGIGVNLVTYLVGTMHLGNSAAVNNVTNFYGSSFMLSLLGGFIADTFFGRYLTVAVFTAIQACGVSILAISTATPSLRPPACSFGSKTCVQADGSQLGVLYLGLYMTALGTGGLKSSVSGFGSDQFDETEPKEKRKMMRFFNYFFFFISIGSLLAVTVLVYVQDNVGRKWGYGICAAAIVTGLVLFLSGTSRYRFKRLLGSPITQIAAVVVAACRKRKLETPSDPALLYHGDQDEAEKNDIKKKSNGKEKLPHTTKFRFLDRAAIVVGDSSKEKSKWQLSTVTDVEELKMLILMLPIWATSIIFWTIYAQMSTFSVAQATRMNRFVGSFQIPSGSLTVFFVGSILVTTPFYDRVVAPLARRATSIPAGLSPLQRIAVGLVVSTLAMAAAAATERRRLDVALAGEKPETVFWLVPQFFLVGAAQAFIYIGQLDFFLRECPKGMKTMSTGLFLSTLSLGFFVSTGLVTVVHKVTEGPGQWLPDDLNKGKLYNFYWLLAVLGTVNFTVFLFCARRYVYKEERMAMEGNDGTELEEKA